jgi:hypothetical protein
VLKFVLILGRCRRNEQKRDEQEGECAMHVENDSRRTGVGSWVPGVRS